MEGFQKIATSERGIRQRGGNETLKVDWTATLRSRGNPIIPRFPPSSGKVLTPKRSHCKIFASQFAIVYHTIRRLCIRPVHLMRNGLCCISNMMQLVVRGVEVPRYLITSRPT